jgi:hypothetical protein
VPILPLPSTSRFIFLLFQAVIDCKRGTRNEKRAHGTGDERCAIGVSSDIRDIRYIRAAGSGECYLLSRFQGVELAEANRKNCHSARSEEPAFSCTCTEQQVLRFAQDDNSIGGRESSKTSKVSDIGRKRRRNFFRNQRVKDVPQVLAVSGI